ncbi:MAG: hypothetical protein ABMA13_18235 [Chthoniobacteraceae bacterium]
MRTCAQILDEVRIAVGERGYVETAERWERVTREDPIAMEQALKDLRFRQADRRLGPVRDVGAWLFGTWVKLRRRQMDFEGRAR